MQPGSGSRSGVVCRWSHISGSLRLRTPCQGILSTLASYLAVRLLALHVAHRVLRLLTARVAPRRLADRLAHCRALRVVALPRALRMTLILLFVRGGWSPTLFSTQN